MNFVATQYDDSILLEFRIDERFANLAINLLNDDFTSSHTYEIVKACEKLPADITKDEYVHIQKFMQTLENLRFFQRYAEARDEEKIYGEN